MTDDASCVEIVRVEVVRDFAPLDLHAQAWDALVACTPPHRPTHSHAWVRTFLEHRCAQGQSWQCALGFVGDQLIAVLPLRAVGNTWVSLRDDHTPTGDAVIAANAPKDTLARLLDAHRSARTGIWAIRLEGVVVASPTHERLRAMDGVQHRPAWMVGATVATTGTFEDILSGLSGNARSKLRRGGRDLEVQGDVTLDVATGTDSVLAAFDAYCAMETAGWKGEQGTAISQDGALLAFYRALLTRLAVRGWARIHTLRAGDTPVASEVLIHCGPALVAHKVTFDPSFKKSSPGNLVWARTLAFACESPDVQWVDLLAMDELMQRWGATPYDYDTFVSFSRGVIPAVFARLPAWIRSKLRAKSAD